MGDHPCLFCVHPHCILVWNYEGFEWNVVCASKLLVNKHSSSSSINEDRSVDSLVYDLHKYALID